MRLKIKNLLIFDTEAKYVNEEFVVFIFLMILLISLLVFTYFKGQALIYSKGLV